MPARLDGTGASAAVVAAEMAALVGEAAVGSLEARHTEEIAALEERVRRSGERGSGRRELEERHRREVRRLRADELRFGLATVESVYHDALAQGSPAQRRSAIDAVTAIDAAAKEIVRNPNELLLLQALFSRLSDCQVPLGGLGSVQVAPG